MTDTDRVDSPIEKTKEGEVANLLVGKIEGNDDFEVDKSYEDDEGHTGWSVGHNNGLGGYRA